jgi:hypothetical protein
MPSIYESLDEFIQKAAESLDLPEGRYRVTDDVIEVAEEFEAAVEESLLEFLGKRSLTAKTYKSLSVVDQVNVLMEKGDAPYYILCTLLNLEEGITDGSWNKFFDSPKEIETIKAFLKTELEDFIDSNGGGFLWEVIEEAAETQSENFREDE